MKIFEVHSYYLSGLDSGENRSVEDEIRLLSEGGHSVESWTPKYERSRGAIKTAIEAIWSKRAIEEVKKRTKAHNIEIVNIHNLYPCLSPTVIRSGTPTVMTLRNWRLKCLAGTLLRNHQVCEECVGRLPWRGVVHRCYRGSRSQSLVLATSLTIHRLLKTFDKVDRFIAMNEFQRDRLVSAGLDPKRVCVRRNFAWPAVRRRGPGEYYVLLGRLSIEKGFDTIVESWRSRWPLIVIGDGPERERLENIAQPGVKFCGVVRPNEVSEYLRKARAMLVPSRGFETGPRVVLEAFAAAVPVVVSDIGGIPELVNDGVSGLLSPPNDPGAWAAAVEQLEDDGESQRLGDGAYESWRENFSPEVALRSLEQIYREAIEHGESR